MSRKIPETTGSRIALEGMVPEPDVTTNDVIFLFGEYGVAVGIVTVYKDEMINCRRGSPGVAK